MTLHRILIMAGAIVAAACGGTSKDATVSSTVQAYRAVGQDMVDAVVAYRAEAATATDRAACDAARERYHDRMEARIARMHELSGEIDGRAARHTCVPDTSCVAEAIAAELEHHAAEGCTGDDPEAHHAEAEAHTRTMTSFLEHQRVRYEEACAALCAMEPPAEATWTCHHNSDDSFTIGEHTWRCGEETPPATSPPAGPATWPEPCGACGERPCAGR